MFFRYVFKRLQNCKYSKLDSIGYYEADKIIKNNCKIYSQQIEIKKIAFLVLNYSSCERFYGVLTHLPKGICDIVYNCADAYKIKKFAKDNSLSCRSLSSVIASNEVYSLAVSHLMWFSWHLIKFLPSVIAKKHIRMIYSHGFSDEVLGRHHNYIYDKILCYGPYQEQILKSRTNAEIVSVGNPALDPYYWECFDVSHIKGKTNQCKKTIAWLTTISEASSLAEFLPMMEKLSEKYNVFINPHPLTSSDDLLLLENSKLKDNIIFGDNLTLLFVADFVFCDYGGACFRALYLDKNIMFFNASRAGMCSILNSDSPEFSIRTRIKNFYASQEKEILKILDDENYWIEQRKIRHQMFCEFFANERGTSSYKVAEILKKDLAKCKSS